mmetsp:Transcript_72461/g.166208  ORF Transcript_72461/g.166208 Transcript_72461/m.166208 type:complete len:358 (+) Transcript_72461:117-1190(+)
MHEFCRRPGNPTNYHSANPSGYLICEWPLRLQAHIRQADPDRVPDQDLVIVVASPGPPRPTHHHRQQRGHPRHAGHPRPGQPLLRPVPHSDLGANLRVQRHLQAAVLEHSHNLPEENIPKDPNRQLLRSPLNCEHTHRGPVVQLCPGVEQKILAREGDEGVPEPEVNRGDLGADVAETEQGGPPDTTILEQIGIERRSHNIQEMLIRHCDQGGPRVHSGHPFLVEALDAPGTAGEGHHLADVGDHQEERKDCAALATTPSRTAAMLHKPATPALHTPHNSRLAALLKFRRLPQSAEPGEADRGQDGRPQQRAGTRLQVPSEELVGPGGGAGDPARYDPEQCRTVQIGQHAGKSKHLH